MSLLSSGTSNTTALVYTSDTTGNLVFQTNGTTEAMRITNGQQVCIGSSTPANPSTLLTVAGNITANSTAFTINGATPALSMYDSTWGYAAANGMYFQPGVNGGGTGLGNYFMANVPSGRGHTWAINNASAMRLESTGTLTLPYGQIAFPASQNASADPNTLDDYEEGSWTPVNASIASITLSVTTGRYIKIGRQVFITCYVSYPATSDTNSAKIGGFPFAATGGEVYGYFGGRTSYSNYVTWQLGSGSTEANCFGGGGGTTINNNNLSGSYILFSGSYIAGS